MFRSFSIGRFAGTTVRIHVTFLLLLGESGSTAISMGESMPLRGC